MHRNTSITNECVRILFGRAPASISTAMVGSAVIIYIFKEQIALPLLFAWFGLMSVISLVRYWMVFDYNKNKDNTVDHKKYERWYLYATGLTGLGWAIFVAVALTLPNHEYHMYALLFLVAILALSVPIFSSSIKTMYCYIAPSLLIIVPLLLSHGGDETALGIALIVFSIMVIRMGKESYLTLIDTLTLRHDTQEQTEKLKQAQRETSEAKGHLAEVFRVAPEAIMTCDSDLNIILFNSAAESIFGYQQSEVLGKHLNMLLPKSLWKKYSKYVTDLDNTEVPSHFMKERPRLVGTKKNGKPFPITASLSSVDTASGKLYIVMMDDITERVRAEESLRISQQRLILHRDQSPMGIIEWNTNFEVVAWNPAAEKIFGYTSEEVMGKVIFDMIVADSAQFVVEDAWKALLANVGGGHTVNENLTKDGRVILCEWNNTSLVDDDGNVIGVTSIVSDVTERHKTEETLRLSQQRLLLHREQSPVGIVEWNTDFKVEDWNPAAERIFGYTRDEVMGQHILDRILPESARATVDDIWDELITNKGGSYSINENITKDGRTILCEWHNIQLVDDDGKIIGVSAIFDDVTKRQKQEDHARQTQKMDAIGNLTGGIAHDFNNMLGVILGFSGLLKRSLGKDNPNQIRYCDEVLNAGERAKKLTSNLLEFSRTAPSSAEVTYINELLDGMRHMLATTLTPRIKIIFELEENIWPVWLDKARLEDAILNICINAMHAMPKSGTLTLKTCAKHLTSSDLDNMDIASGDYIALSLSDTGAGMTKEVQQQIFDPFFTTKGTEGTGLGLSQVYGFIQQAGGSIQVYSELGQGTKITLYIPRHHVTKDDRPEKPTPAPIELTTGQGTILVVDDEAALLMLNEKVLSNCGYTVLTAHNAAIALQILKSHTVDLMLCDVIMPGMNGYQLADEVKRLFPQIKIQMMSGYSDERNLDGPINMLYNQRLQKPVSFEVLLSRVKKLLNE